MQLKKKKKIVKFTMDTIMKYFSIDFRFYLFIDV